MALGALHRAFVSRQNPYVGPSTNPHDTHHSRAIRHYGKAIRHFKQDSLEKMDLSCILLSCLVMFGFEAYHGNSVMAETQIKLAMNFACAREAPLPATHRQLPKKPQEHTYEDYVVQFLGRLELQTNSLRGKKTVDEEVMPESDVFCDIKAIPDMFVDLHAAQSYLHILMRRVQFFLGLSRPATELRHPDLSPDEDKLQECEALKKRQQAEKIQPTLVKEAEKWKKTFDATLSQDSMKHERDAIMVTVLSLQSEMDYIMLTTTLQDPIIWDSMTAKFEGVIDLAVKLTGFINMTSARFTFDLGSIMPLYFVALNCREKRVRERAIRQLLDDPRREGIWDSVGAGRVAIWVRDLEEACIEDGKIPPWARIKYVDSEFDFQKRCAVTKCLQQVKVEGSFKVVEQAAKILW
jgi:hypothetical protein